MARRGLRAESLVCIFIANRIYLYAATIRQPQLRLTMSFRRRRYFVASLAALRAIAFGQQSQKNAAGRQQRHSRHSQAGSSRSGVPHAVSVSVSAPRQLAQRFSRRFYAENMVLRRSRRCG